MSTLPENSKMASLTQEVVRRMRNTSEKVNMKERIAHLDKFAQKLINSGYSMEQAKNITVAGLKGYQKALDKATKEGRSIHISAAEGAASRNQKKLLSKTQWFKEKSDPTNGEEGGREQNNPPPPRPSYRWRMPAPTRRISPRLAPWCREKEEQWG